MLASEEKPEEGTYTKVLMNPLFNPRTRQSIGFYEGIINSRNLLYKGERRCIIFLKTQSQAMNLLRRRKGWVDITKEWIQQKEEPKLLEDKKLEEPKEDKPVKRKRGRPRKVRK